VWRPTEENPFSPERTVANGVFYVQDEEIPQEATATGLAKSRKHEQGGLRTTVLQCGQR